MSPEDPYDAGRNAAEDLRRTLEAVREDVRAVVREEVGRAGLPESELKRMVGELVREEIAAARAAEPRRPVALLAAAALILGVLTGAVGYRVLVSSGADRPGAVGTDGAPGAAPVHDSTGAAGPPGSPASPVAEERSGDGEPAGASGAALYDSLFRAAAPELGPLAADLDGVAAAPVLSALASWRAGSTLGPGPRRRLHDALVQAAVNRLAGEALALDGLVTRDPCGGASCGAVLRLWEDREAEWGLPRYPAEPDSREAGLPVVERLLVLRALEVAGG